MIRILGVLVPTMVAAALLAGSALAQNDCNGTRVTDLVGTLQGNLVCGSEIGGSDTWQEEHRADGELFEIARGPNDPVDPSHVVGTWSTQTGNDGNDEVCYDYGSPDVLLPAV